MMKLSSALTCIAFAALACACSKSPSGQQQPPPPEVGVLAAQPQSVPLERSLVGRLSAFRSADVRARVAGILLERVYSEGSDVKEGALLFRIDPTPLRATLNGQLANLASAEATYANNHIAAERARSVGARGLLSQSDVDAANAAERTAAAAVQQAKANVEAARINLGYADVTAPIAGRAGKQQVTEGALVGQGEATLLTTIDQIDPLYVNFTMSVADIEAMRRAASNGGATLAGANQAAVHLALPDGTPYAPVGTVDFSGALVDPATGSVALRAQVANPDHVLLPGMYVTLTAVLGKRHGVYPVPQRAVQRDAVGSFVLVVGADGKVARKDITATDAIEGNWIVTSGLEAGDQVIVSGLQRAQVGQPARPTPWQPPSAAAATPDGNAQ
ncbi:efflux RND transporter periplasmic adaptor subunit [Dokdonella sp.]|uniref:efflux RND transporter periplasmic adaptor subunit n=1 Tax=Dokdonella sp. TaxID=2291710 RepID=UPI0031C35077|nr:efflux RND transporter periplasmic adaptor subunit [Dokdonella sp.]